MGERIFELLQRYFAEHAYWTVAIALLLENSGVPVPGETILLFAGFMAFSQHLISLPLLILTGTVAATLGDNIGYAIGRRGGRPLLNRYQHIFRIRPATIAKGERLFERHGPVTIFFARFIFGMRIIAGPLAGVMHMPWLRFALFNFLGAALWVTTVSCIGYFFGSQWDLLIEVLKRFNLAVIVIAVTAGLIYLWQRRRRVKIPPAGK